MLKKILILLAPLAAVVALALIPVSASADLQCPKGAKNASYCRRVCHVPNVVGHRYGTQKERDQVSDAFKNHDCKLGKVYYTEVRDKNGSKTSPEAMKQDEAIEHGYEGGIIVKQNETPGSDWPAGHPVNILVET